MAAKEQSSSIPFNPRCSVATLQTPDVKLIPKEPMAFLTIPNIEEAARFINTSSDTTIRRNPVSVEYLSATHETPAGSSNEYDAFVSSPDSETGEVRMTIRQYGNQPVEKHRALSSFVMNAIDHMAE